MLEVGAFLGDEKDEAAAVGAVGEAEALEDQDMKVLSMEVTGVAEADHMLGKG